MDGNNATADTPAGAFAYVAPSAKVGAALGYWSKIGDGAVVPATVTLGSWSNVGHFSKVGHFVTFGPWASVGMDSVVQAGSKLGSHEYVPSGHMRLVSGHLIRRRTDERDRRIHDLFDWCFGSRGPRCIPIEQAHSEDRERERNMDEIASLLPDYLARHKTKRPLLRRLLSLVTPEA